MSLHASSIIGLALHYEREVVIATANAILALVHVLYRTAPHHTTLMDIAANLRRNVEQIYLYTPESSEHALCQATFRRGRKSHIPRYQ